MTENYNDEALLRGIYALAARNPLFVTGRAGAGKTTLLREFVRYMKHTNSNIMVTAFTGVAALGCQGQTINSLFRFPPGITVEEVRSKFKRRSKLFRELEVLVIDEISMVRADLMDCIETFLRINGDPDKPFGGVRIVMFGDLYQLQPVAPRNEWNALSEVYQTPYFFSAETFRQDTAITLLELDRSYRQEDADFKELLDRLRMGTYSDGDIDTINQGVMWDENDLPTDELALLFACHRANAERFNQHQLRKIDSPVLELPKGEINGKYSHRNLPAPQELIFKSGAQIILLCNDSEKRWVNGTLATIKDKRTITDSVTGKTSTVIDVELASGDIVEVAQYIWENFEFYYDRERKCIRSRVVGSYTQFPMMLGWAMTIHKSQGQTLDTAIIDFGSGAFTHGQAYVALSRVRKIDGLYLRRPLTSRDIQIDTNVDKFINSFTAIGENPQLGITLKQQEYFIRNTVTYNHDSNNIQIIQEMIKPPTPDSPV